MGLCPFFLFSFLLSTHFLFSNSLILLSGIFIKDKICALYLAQSFQLLWKKKRSCRNISASYKGLQEWCSKDLSAAEAQVGVTQHHKEGRFGPSSLHLGKYLIYNSYRSRLIFPSLILCHKETSQKQMFILLSWSTRYFSNAYRIRPLTHFCFHFRQYHLDIMQYTLHGLNFF